MIYNNNELVDKFVLYLSELWEGWRGYADALPETEREQNKSPFFVVFTETGTYSTTTSTCVLNIGLQVSSDAKDDTKTYVWAIRTLRDCINKLNTNLFNCSNGLFDGVLIQELSWDIPITAPRPKWQALITMTVEMPHGVHDNGDFLI